jgi:hypothetical protein
MLIGSFGCTVFLKVQEHERHAGKRRPKRWRGTQPTVRRYWYTRERISEPTPKREHFTYCLVSVENYQFS